MLTDERVEQYIALRDAKEALKREFDAKQEAINKQMEDIADDLREVLKELGAESLSTAHGTVYRTIKTRYWSGDWESIKKFVRENDALDLLERRIHQSNMKQWLSDHPDQVPPGLNIDAKYDVIVRRK